ncbi:MAG TPA: RNA polymerase sigma factor [Bryobacteraceae bacterium]|nr:RNA polymerase sigma factor [Bryobacteraceae bacterium]
MSGSREADGPDEVPGLLARAKAGGEAAFEQLMKKHERQVLLTSLRLLGRLEDAQDAAQEVFLRLHRNLKIFASVAEIRPWLYRVTVNVCRDLLRKRRRGGLELLDDSLRADGAPLDEEIGREQQRALLAEALTRLPEKERTALVLRDIEGLDTAEVAEILGSAPATVRSQVSTGRERLRGIVARLMRRSL